MHASVWAVLLAQRYGASKDRPERLSCREGEGEGEAALEGEGETAANSSESSPSCSCLCSRAASCRHTRRRGPAPHALQVTAHAGRNALRPHLCRCVAPAAEMGMRPDMDMSSDLGM